MVNINDMKKGLELLKNRVNISNLNNMVYERDVVLSGWIINIKNIGDISFIILRDETGEVQITLKKEILGSLEFIKELSNGSFIVVYGKYIKGISKKYKEVLCNELYLINEPAAPLPIDENSHFDKRMDYRWIDLRDPQKSFVIRLISEFIKYSREYLYKNNFIEIFSPKIISSATESGSEVFELKYFDKKAYLAQSPQFYKQMAICAGFEKVFEIAPAFRAEPSFTSRHLTEFTSFDIEVGYISSHYDLMALEEELIVYSLNRIKENYEDKIKNLYNVDIEIPKKFEKIKMEDVYEIIGKNNIKDNGDISSEGEKILGKYIKDNYKNDFVYIIDWPWTARPFYHMKGEPMRDGRTTTKSFDLLYKGLEITTGSQREHRYSILVNQIKEKGMNPDNFKSYLEFFKYGSPTMGGFGFGISRFIKQLLNIENVKEVVLVPRDPNRLEP
ncbi:aspartate--tRNA(Asn) ligase [Nanobdella aerobiophila]|uniref:Aspartate--tRNA(Asp) ligase n=1 Tax=Nanobdella aerobiophila TaxID=2586965 RepID=A0A915WSN3_9ARCH|nr:aspartate--tRNA(Asn) ligase [Nanobdella aerobiophila]BBL45387.1 aspartate--tRNA(Asn) ligase [Nanobdella aerobiophila]